MKSCVVRQARQIPHTKKEFHKKSFAKHRRSKPMSMALSSADSKPWTPLTFSAMNAIKILDWLSFVIFFLRVITILGSDRTATNPSLQEEEQPKNFPRGFYAIRPERYFLTGLLPQNEYKWFIDNVPFIDFRDDEDILTAYYYRWQMYKKHIRFVKEKNIYVITEFLPDVPWAGEYNTIPAAAGHHIMEGRWIHDERILNDYIEFWFSDTSSKEQSRNNATSVKNPNLSSYTNWVGYASWHRYLLNGNANFVKSILDSLATTFRDIYVPKYLKEILWNDANAIRGSKKQQVLQCWWQNDGYDAMEYSSTSVLVSVRAKNSIRNWKLEFAFVWPALIRTCSEMRPIKRTAAGILVSSSPLFVL